MHNGAFIRPPTYFDVDGPLVFLAGPVQGAPDWQFKAMNALWYSMPTVNIASPRREGKLAYAEQVDWETHYLCRAAKDGVILFWLANEEVVVPGRAYAQTSRVELGVWTTEHKHDSSIKVVIGIDDKFSGGRYIHHQYAPPKTDIPLTRTLEDTVHVTLGMLKGCKYGYQQYVPR